MSTSKERGDDTQQRLCLSVPEAARLLGISRGLAYQLARSGQLPVIRLGRRLLVAKAALENLLLKSNSTDR